MDLRVAPWNSRPILEPGKWYKLQQSWYSAVLMLQQYKRLGLRELGESIQYAWVIHLYGPPKKWGQIMLHSFLARLFVGYY